MTANRESVEALIPEARAIDDVPFTGRIVARALLDVADAIREHGEAVREAAGLQPRPPEQR